MSAPRCQGIVAATEFFGGDIAAAETRFRNALELMDSAPDADRDRVLRATILANLGAVAEVKHEWARAENLHREALRLRREVADARGAVQSLHAVGRALLGAGDRGEAEQYFCEAERLAEGLDETLERAKIRQTRADLLLRDGDTQGARELAAAALATFTDSRTRYDVTHARVELARIARASGQGREAAEQGARARADVLAMGYGLLSLMYPDTAYDLCERIEGALTTYACGDALGLPWENRPKASSVAQIEQLPAREGWPRGSTTDDTALTLLAARHLTERDGDCDVRGFLAELAAQEPAIRGLGPTTTAAIEHFRRSGKIAPSTDRATNGAAMRALPVGWVLSHAKADQRRQLAIEISRATHAAPASLVAACVVAACASWSLEGADPALLLEVAIGEARAAAQAVDTDARLADMLTKVSEETWATPIGGITLDPYETVTAVLSCVMRARSLRDGLVSAVRLGGDTDTVAALVGGLMGCCLTIEQVLAELPWHRLVLLPRLEDTLTETATALSTTRAVQSE